MINYKVSRKELNERKALPLWDKVQWAIERYIDYVEIFGQRGVYKAFSGGKDSQVMKHIIDDLHDGRMGEFLRMEYRLLYRTLIEGKPSPPDVHCKTGIEFPEIDEHVKTFDGVIILKPKMGFTRVIKEVGAAIGSKKIAMMIRRAKGYLSNPNPKNEATLRLYTTGIKRDGTVSKASKIPDRWLKVLDAPFLVSDKCCDIFKKEPFRRYEKETGRVPIVGTLAEESDQRTVSYMKTGCITWDRGKESCRPLSIWTEKDIWDYADLHLIRFCSVYYDRTVEVKQLDGSLAMRNLPAERQTGCTICLFGLHLEPKGKPNRIQRLAVSHPIFYNVMVNKCGIGEMLEWMEITYKPFRRYCQTSLFEEHN
ncbi:phosphoadenosine phosphosulfate reductase domain-containing protein [Dyadobacter bucti]|uniref:phosphoadenosine phosphosulfate reductase domain-containing protein n=1 Tax=Dyadobacter bucti TaxID=2572203 RepID=UPI0011097E50|nr:phosphoadenosine phosphosulfate reductase family protein [Dyadobacter bucti]